MNDVVDAETGPNALRSMVHLLMRLLFTKDELMVSVVNRKPTVMVSPDGKEKYRFPFCWERLSAVFREVHRYNPKIKIPLSQNVKMDVNVKVYIVELIGLVSNRKFKGNGSVKK